MSSTVTVGVECGNCINIQCLCDAGSRMKPSSHTIIELVVTLVVGFAIVFYFRDYVNKARAWCRCLGMREGSNNGDNDDDDNVFVHADAVHLQNVHIAHHAQTGTPNSDNGSAADEIIPFSGEGLLATPVAGDVELVPVIPVTVVPAGGVAAAASSSTVLMRSNRLFGLPILAAAAASGSLALSSSSSAAVASSIQAPAAVSARQPRSSTNVVEVQVMLIGEEDDEYSLHNDDVRAECV